LRRAAAIDGEGDGMQILWNLTAIASLLAVVFIITQDDGGDDRAALHQATSEETGKTAGQPISWASRHGEGATKATKAATAVAPCDGTSDIARPRHR